MGKKKKKPAVDEAVALAEAALLVRTVAVTTTVSVPWPWIGVIGFFWNIWPRLIEGRGEWGCAFAAGRRRVAVPCVFTERVLQRRWRLVGVGNG